LQNYSMSIPVEKTSKPKIHPAPDQLGFGQFFTDHMFLMEYSEAKGWHNPRITPYQPLPIDPGACVLHYGQALFEGMKAFSQKNDDVVLFRPQYNCQRLITGATRLCMQAPPADLMLEGIQALVRTDQAWVPKFQGGALYIRPTLIATEAFLGVRPSKNYLFYVILSPVGSYYKEGLNPISIWVEEKYIRAAPGGLGATKAGANYASSLLAAQEAKKKGCAQVLWLDVTHEHIEEVGTMNVFFKIDDQILTPSLNGSILAGGTRDSVIQVLKSWNLPVIERRLSLAEILEAHSQGRLQEAFGTGTAAVISPIGEFQYRDRALIVNGRAIGPLAQKLYKEFTDLQYGEKPDTRQWLMKI